MDNGRTVWVVIVGLFIIGLLAGCGGKQQTGAIAPSRLVVPESGKMTLGVLYFDNYLVSKDHDALDRLRMGMVGALITELSKIERLIVVERTRIEELRNEIEMQWKGDGFDQSTIQKFGKLLGAQTLCFGQFTDTPEEWGKGGCFIPFMGRGKGEDEMRIDARIVVVETGAILKAEEVTGPKKDLFKLIKLLGLKIADRLETDLGVTVTKIDRKNIEKRDTVYSTVSMVKFEEARETEKQAELTLEEAQKLEEALREAKELEAQRLFEDAKRKYEEALAISPQYVEAKQAIERLGKGGAM